MQSFLRSRYFRLLFDTFLAKSSNVHAGHTVCHLVCVGSSSFQFMSNIFCSSFNFCFFNMADTKGVSNIYLFNKFNTNNWVHLWVFRAVTRVGSVVTYWARLYQAYHQSPLATTMAFLFCICVFAAYHANSSCVQLAMRCCCTCTHTTDKHKYAAHICVRV